ncbi:hypothetical protein I314_00752 [Cryptococcus bacillisporus CA1873]|uniref:Zn(2)-C6 fungal-type domain-containing protein n=1 Tax=Cryptococcus bacillisporus CA1873 TaxID=1296111 RepID=A0ABR5BLB0_CRYGA|nr:hypothetical protein I314_06638 [Cryptococcus bacillisporus CA1873]KIR69638.1 hypothetical protein I314_00752 [Cryptococcus bacillisporus CA1873]|eukprot:KIR57499.1 hypothetical protein I314_06638 [Cryptococcus gattii CA1873]
MSASTEDLSSFFFSPGTVAPDSAVAPSDLFFIPTQLQNTEFNTQPWSISNNELPATEPQAEFSLGQDALAGDDDDFVSYFANLFGNGNDADSVGQTDTQQGDWQPSVNNHNIHTEEPHELFGQKRIDEFIGWDFNISVPDAYLPPIAPALVPVTPATQAYLTILSKPSIPETPKAPSKPRRTSSRPKASRIPKSPSKKGSLKDALFGPRVVSSSGPKTRGAISCLACRDRKKPCDGVYQFKCERCIGHGSCCQWAERGRGVKLGRKQRDEYIRFIAAQGEQLGQREETTMTVDLMKAPKLPLDFQRDLSSFSSTSSGLGLSTSSVYSSLESLVLQTPDVTDMDLTNSTAKVESSKEYLDLNQFSW